MTEPEIKAIAKLSLVPGDTLVVWLPADSRDDMALHVMRAFVSMGYDPSIKCIVTKIGMELSVIKGGETQ